jgi:hypothetical protein
MSDYDLLLDALRDLKAQSGSGFEGLIRDCLETLSKRTLRLQKSGPQGGKDILSDADRALPVVALETKRFGEKTAPPQDELRSKLRDALRSSPEIDIWGLVLSREMKQPDWGNLQQIGAEYGVTLICLDWREEPGSLPLIAVVCCAGRHIAERRLLGKLVPIFDKIERHADFERIVADLRRQLTAPETGMDLARQAAQNWLKTVVSSATASRQNLRSHADILSDDAHCVSRPEVERQLDAWLNSRTTTPAVLLGDEGRGKTWAALRWSIQLLDRPNAPLVIVTSAKDISPGDAGDALANALVRGLPLVPVSDLKRRMLRWAQSQNPVRALLIVDALTKNGASIGVNSSSCLELIRGRVASPYC